MTCHIGHGHKLNNILLVSYFFIFFQLLISDNEEFNLLGIYQKKN